MTERWMKLTWYDFDAHLAGTNEDGVEVLVAINDMNFKKKVENREYGFSNGSRLKVKTNLEREVYVNDAELLFWQVSEVLDTEMCINSSE